MTEHTPEFAAQFPTTHWPKVRAAGQPDSPGSFEALGELLHRYHPVLHAHLVRRLGLAEEKAEDFLQSFIQEKVLEKGLLSHAAPERGKFRTFLLSTLNNYCLNQLRDERAQRRAPKGGMLSLDGLEEGPAAGETAPGPASFDVAWALHVMKEAQQRMLQHCHAIGRHDVWEAFAGRLLRPLLQGVPPVPYGELVEKLGYASPDKAFNALGTGKRMFERMIKSVIGEYVTDPGQVDSELEELKQILSCARAWPEASPGKED